MAGSLSIMAFGLVIIGCGTTSDVSPEKGTIIVIEDITDYTGDISIRVFSNLNHIDSHQPVNAGIGFASITGNSVSIELSAPSNNTGLSKIKWRGNGSYYYIYFLPKGDNNYSSAAGKIFVGSGEEPQRYNINEAVMTLSYNDFKPYNTYKN
jgi:hypothetical protein